MSAPEIPRGTSRSRWSKAWHEAARRGWKRPALTLTGPWQRAWLNYWQAMRQYEAQLAAGMEHPPRPVMPHIPGTPPPREAYAIPR